MKKLYTVVARTKAEHGSGSAPSVVAPTAYPTFPAAKAALRASLNAATVTYGQIYGPSGLIYSLTNPAGA
jgi:hypothetical protein